MTLKKRIETLEHHLAIDDDIRGVFFNRVVAGDDGPEVIDADGYQFQDFAPTHRQEGESTQKLQERALQQIAAFIPSAQGGLSRPVAIFKSLHKENGNN